MNLIRLTVRMDYHGNILSEKTENIPGDPEAEIKFLGKLLASKLQNIQERGVKFANQNTATQ